MSSPDNKLAVLDMGSNTFHLIIVYLDHDKANFSIIDRKRILVYLSRDGVNHLNEATLERAHHALSLFRKMCDEHQVSKIKALGTMALRSVSNAQDFIDDVKVKYDFDVEIIGGQREAELIHKGTLFTSRFLKEKIVIMDIGGGSVEFIISDHAEMSFWQSKNIGISILKKEFRKEDEKSLPNTSLVESYIDKALRDVISAINLNEVSVLAGASGAFEIFEFWKGSEANAEGNVFERVEILAFLNKVTLQSQDQRMQNPHLPAHRSDMALESFLLIKHVLNCCKSITKVVVTPYALKEGVIREFLNLD